MSSKTSKEKLILFGNIGSIKYYRAQIVAQYNDKEVIMKECKNDDTISNNVKLEGNGVELTDSNAISFYLANDQLRCSNDLFMFSEVLQWLSYADNHILPAVSGWVIPCITKHVPNNVKAGMKTSKEDLLSSLTKLNNILLTKTYLVGERISLADIAIFTALIPLYEHLFDSQYRIQYKNLTRWFFTILNQPQVTSILKNFQMCEKVVKH